MTNMKKRLIYGGCAALIFLIECLLVGTSGFLRYTLGDLLVVMLIYAALRVILPDRPKPLWMAVGVFAFALCVELSQYFNLIGLLGLGDEKLAHLTMGSTFDLGDIAAYALGCGAALEADWWLRRKNQPR